MKGEHTARRMLDVDIGPTRETYKREAKPKGERCV